MSKETLAGFSYHVGICRDGLEDSTDIFSAAKKLLGEDAALWAADAHHFAPILLFETQNSENEVTRNHPRCFCL